MNLSPPYIDVGYHFMVGGDGAIYEGRGWDVIGAHTRGYNDKSISVAFVGNYTLDDPNDKQLEAAKKLLDFGVKRNKLTRDYKLYGQCQLQPKESPGEKLFLKIKDWQHWCPDSKFECKFAKSKEYSYWQIIQTFILNCINKLST